MGARSQDLINTLLKEIYFENLLIEAQQDCKFAIQCNNIKIKILPVSKLFGNIVFVSR